MASATVKAAVQARLQDWPGRAGCPFYDENDAAPAPKTQYLTIEYPVANEDRISIGARPALFRETGAIRFVVHILNMSGLEDAMALVETLRDFFREQKFGGVETFEASPPALDKSNRARAFYLLPFVVTYKFDQIR
jgi:Bacteriophage related domain of unknown function